MAWRGFRARGIVKPELWALVGLGAVLGCAPRLEPVEVEFRRVSVEEMEHGVVELALANPNRFALDIENLEYQVFLGDDTLALGSRAAPVHIDAEDTAVAEFGFEIVAGLGEVLAALPGILEDTLELKLCGRYSLPSLLGPKKRPFEYRKTIPLASELDKLLGPLRSPFDRGDGD